MSSFAFLLRSGIIASILCFPVLHVDAHENVDTKQSLKQLISQSRDNLKKDPRLFFGSPIKFEPQKVRENYYGNEKEFLQEICTLLHEGKEEDRFDVLNLIFHLDITDESVSKCLREEFESFDDHFLQSRIIYAIARDARDENIDFLLAVFEKDAFPPVFRIQIATLLSDIDFLELLDDESIKKIYNVFSNFLDDNRKYKIRGWQCQVGNGIAFALGNFGDLAKDSLATIQNKYSSITDDIAYENSFNKIRLASAIVRIDPSQTKPLGYIIQTAMNNESKHLRLEAVSLLGQMDFSLSEKVISCLCEVIQKETIHENRLQAVESLKMIFDHQKDNRFD